MGAEGKTDSSSTNSIQPQESPHNWGREAMAARNRFLSNWPFLTDHLEGGKKKISQNENITSLCPQQLGPPVWNDLELLLASATGVGARRVDE